MKRTVYKSASSRTSKPAASAESYPYKDRNLAAMQPEQAQEALKPTDAEPVPLHKRMAGCS